MLQQESPEIRKAKFAETNLWIDTYHALSSNRQQLEIKRIVESQISNLRARGAMTEAFHLTVRLNENN